MSTRSKVLSANISRLRDDCLGDLEHIEKLIKIFNESVEEYLASVAMYIKAKDRFSIVRAGGKLKTGLLMIEANSLLDYLDMIDYECQQLDALIYVETLISDFKGEYLHVRDELKKQVEKLHG
ncbi:hypothetical protein [Robertkochia solimangrovi]|uniref:hypothetical protein n=1 Tax=Robertkochia solimangrovi TaxID=2213046 RepID=UPI00117C6484|nr:hypothetical protein [Robertkochia solimangrovi]TRZ45292.1 hypothetical protein DMZ48_05980 [Robertkochia solimangrovi]